MLYVNPMALSHIPQVPVDEATREKQALQELEQYFVYTLLEEMRKTVPEGGLFTDKQERSLYQEMLDDSLAKEIAASGQFGIAKQIAEQIQQNEAQRHFSAKAAGARSKNTHSYLG